MKHNEPLFIRCTFSTYGVLVLGLSVIDSTNCAGFSDEDEYCRVSRPELFCSGKVKVEVAESCKLIMITLCCSVDEVI